MRTPPTALLIGSVFAASLAAVAAAPQSADTAAQSVKDVMATMTVPASDAIFTAATEPPTSEAQWVALRTSIEQLAESGRLLMTGPRVKDTTTWMEHARSLVTMAEATLKAAEAHDADALAEASDEVYLACESCHKRYLDQ